MDYLLSLVIFFPSFGAIILGVFLRAENYESNNNAKLLALVSTIATFIFSLFIIYNFKSHESGFQLVEEYQWLMGLTYKVGIDGISLPLILLTTVTMPIVIVSSWKIENKVKEYMICFLLLETLILGVFCSLDLVLFYLFFESGLIPMFLIIGIWGGNNRVYAAFKFFLYTLLGSILMLLAIIYMWAESGTTDIPTLMSFDFDNSGLELFGYNIVGGMQSVLWMAFFASFAVKLPMWPFHTWLPDAHVQAPTGGSVVLAAILLKMGGYGFLRFSLPMFPDASVIFQNFIFIISVIAILYTSLVALVQTDIKKLIAYSSVAHMGFVTLGIFSMNQQGIDGAIFQMISHGIISAALFLLVGVIYDRMHTRDIHFYGGLVLRMPNYALIFIFFTMANIGLPGTSGFVGEFLVLLGAFQENKFLTIIASIGIVLSACYALWLSRSIIFGKITNNNLLKITDLDGREKLFFIPLVVLTLLLGILPFPILEITSNSVGLLVSNFVENIE
ncbi:MAG: NADH-quinone oxidoreductase subunit M [Paracoccaceae bacterium]